MSKKSELKTPSELASADVGLAPRGSTLLPGAAPKQRGNRPPAAGIGRKKGVPNKITRDVREMVLGALADAGGQEYLAKQAHLNPGAFLSLVGKTLPKDIKVEGSIDHRAAVSEAVGRALALLFKPPGQPE